MFINHQSSFTTTEIQHSVQVWRWEPHQLTRLSLSGRIKLYAHQAQHSLKPEHRPHVCPRSRCKSATLRSWNARLLNSVIIAYDMTQKPQHSAYSEATHAKHWAALWLRSLIEARYILLYRHSSKNSFRYLQSSQPSDTHADQKLCDPLFSKRHAILISEPRIIEQQRPKHLPT